MGSVDWSKVPPPAESKVDWGKVPPPTASDNDKTSAVGASAAHAINALEFGAGPVIHSLSAVLGRLPFHVAVSVAPQLLNKWGIKPEDQKPILQQFSDYKKGIESYLGKSQKEHPLVSGISSGLGAGAAAVLTGGGGAAENIAAKAPTFYETMLNAARPSAAYGTVAGLAGSKADLTSGNVDEVKKAIRDELRGFEAGGLIGAGAGAVQGVASKVADAAAPFLEKLGLSQITKATVGKSSRAQRLLREKGLEGLFEEGVSEDASRYLADNLKVGAGDSTESIAEKLIARGKKVRGDMDGTIQQLDSSGQTVDPENVAKRIEEAAAPFNYEPTDKHYRALMDRADAIRKYFAGKKLSFSESVKTRRAADKVADWNNMNKDVGASEENKTVARAWNDEIDSTAEPLLQQQGEAGDAFRSQRHEYAKVAELRDGALKNLDRQQSQEHGFVSGASSYLPRTFGKALAGRAALNAADSLRGSKDEFYDMLRGAALSSQVDKQQ